MLKRPLKIEKDVYVEMSGRQGIQYWDTVKSVSKSDVKSALAPSTGQESSYRYLYNIIMHLRKVCRLCHSFRTLLTIRIDHQPSRTHGANGGADAILVLALSAASLLC